MPAKPSTTSAFASSRAGRSAAKTNQTGLGNPVLCETIPTGGTADLWGETWTPADVNASDFGAALSGDAASIMPTALVDVVTITVHYTSNGAPSFASSRLPQGLIVGPATVVAY